MKVRTIRYIIKDGVLNTYKNKLMSLASISISAAAIIIFGIFILFLINLRHNTEILKQQPELEVFCEYELSDAQVKQVELEIQKIEGIKEYSIVTKSQAFEKFKEKLGDDSDILEGYDENLLPVSFIIKLDNYGSTTSSNIIESLKRISGVRKVSYFKELSDFLFKFTKWINLISGVLVAILLIFSVSVIANTIKLTVFARRKEISIMKYIGATDWFIRWPFIVEGVLIGLGGAVIAYLLTRFGYSTIESRFNSDLSTISISFIKIVSLEEVNSLLMLCYALLGSIVGAAGSVISIRKYLRV
jgi:cell division transport system permease protein